MPSSSDPPSYLDSIYKVIKKGELGEKLAKTFQRDIIANEPDIRTIERIL